MVKYLTVLMFYYDKQEETYLKKISLNMFSERSRNKELFCYLKILYLLAIHTDYLIETSISLLRG